MSSAPLVDVAEATLAAVIDHWPVVSATLPSVKPLPTRQYVVAGLPARDCEQVTVSWSRTFPTAGSPTQEQTTLVGGGKAILRVAVFEVEILRCIPRVQDGPSGQPVIPSATAIQDASLAILTDESAIMTALIAALNAGDLGGCGSMAIEGTRAVSADGGLSGGATKVRLSLF